MEHTSNELNDVIMVTVKKFDNTLEHASDRLKDTRDVVRVTGTKKMSNMNHV